MIIYCNVQVCGDASFEKPPVPREIRNNANLESPPVPSQIEEKASPQEVIAELKKIPDLARNDWLTAFDMLRYNDFQFRSLKALPMDRRKEWLLNEIK